MSIFDSIGNAFKNAGETIAHGTESIADKIAVSTVNGANLFASGWKDVFQGNIVSGFEEVGKGMAQCVGIPTGSGGSGLNDPSQDPSSHYTDAVAAAAQMAAQLANASGHATCFSVYENQVKQNLANLGLAWQDSMDQLLRANAASLGFIDLGC